MNSKMKKWNVMEVSKGTNRPSWNCKMRRGLIAKAQEDNLDRMVYARMTCRQIKAFPRFQERLTSF